MSTTQVPEIENQSLFSIGCLVMRKGVADDPTVGRVEELNNTHARVAWRNRGNSIRRWVRRGALILATETVVTQRVNELRRRNRENSYDCAYFETEFLASKYADQINGLGFRTELRDISKVNKRTPFMVRVYGIRHLSELPQIESYEEAA